MIFNFANDMRESVNSYSVVFKEIIESDIGVDYKIYPSNKEKDKYLVSLCDISKKYVNVLEYNLFLNAVIRLNELSTSYRKKDLRSKVVFLSLEKELEKIDTIANDNIYNNDIYINVVAFFEGKLINIRDNKCCININNQNIIFPLKRKMANDWNIYVNKSVRIYAKVKKNMSGKIIEGIYIYKLEPIEILDKNKVKKDFYDLMKKLNVSNLTQIIIDMRHKDE